MFYELQSNFFFFTLALFDRLSQYFSRTMISFFRSDLSFTASLTSSPTLEASWDYFWVSRYCRLLKSFTLWLFESLMTTQFMNREEKALVTTQQLLQLKLKLMIRLFEMDIKEVFIDRYCGGRSTALSRKHA